jgi:hypothetical protein
MLSSIALIAAFSEAPRCVDAIRGPWMTSGHARALAAIRMQRTDGATTKPWDGWKRMPVRGTPAAPVDAYPRIVIIGGTGRIGTAVAVHLLSRSAPVRVQLAGRDAARGEAAVREVRGERMGFFSRSTVTFLRCDWRDADGLASVLEGAAAVVHTAGPYSGETPEVLRAAIAACVPVYVDLAGRLDVLVPHSYHPARIT